MRRNPQTRAYGRYKIDVNIGTMVVSTLLLFSLLFGCNTTKEVSPRSKNMPETATGKGDQQKITEVGKRDELQPEAKKKMRDQTEKTWRDPVTGMEFIRVPGGCYEMGCGSWTGNCDNDSKPVHKVCLDEFWIGKYEVTLEQWTKIVAFRRPEIITDPDHPVENISFNDAGEFIKLLNANRNDESVFRLPTEAEWEYACRSGGKREIYAGSNEIERAAWYRNNSDKRPHKVGTKEPNGLGIYDMSGNVREWCGDTYNGNAYNNHQSSNPIYQRDGLFRVVRGGGYNTVAFFCRSTSRFRLNPRDRRSGVGFRIVKETAKEMNSVSIGTQAEGKNSYSNVGRTGKIGTVKVTLGNVRSGPSRKHKIIATIKKGEKVSILRKENRWFYIRSAHGRMGWCHQSLLNVKNR